MILSGLIAIMIPVVMDQATRGEPTRAGGDLSAIGSALSMFRAHTLSLPDDIEDLVNAPTVQDRQLDGLAYSPSMLDRWNGPYLDVSMEPTGPADALSPDSIPTGFKAFISPALALFDGVSNDSLPLTAAADANFVALMIRGLNDQEFEALNDLVDGEAEAEGSPGCVRCSHDRGNLRWDPASQVAYYLAIPYRAGS